MNDKKNLISFKKVYKKVKKITEDAIENKNIEAAIKYTQCLSILNINYFCKYFDYEIENSIDKISKLIFQDKIYYESNESNVILIDSMAWDNHCLTQQYLRAMMENDLNILYLVIGNINKCKNIIAELNRYNKSKIIVLSESSDLKNQIQIFNKEIQEFKASRIFVQSFSILDAIALKALGTPTIFRINLGDHHCWSGVTSTEFIIDFRNWGATLSNEVRNFATNKILLLPYYPINDENKFEGLPEIGHDKVLIFSGGAVYKILDEKNTFLNLVLKILNQNPRAVILFACRGDDSILRKFILKNNLENRLLLIGYRKDIYEVVKHIDIYLDTYPETGGLMQQYAALNGKPILSCCNSENLYNATINYHEIGTYKTRYLDVTELLDECQKLISDLNYRGKIGESLRKSVINPKNFANIFNQIYYQYKSPIKSEKVNFNFEKKRENDFKISIRTNRKYISSILLNKFSYKYLYLFINRIVFISTALTIFGKLKKNSSVFK